MNQEMLQKLITLVSEVKIGLIAVNNYVSSRNGEVSRRRVNIGFKWENIKKDDFKTLEDGVAFIPSEKYTQADWDMAILELKRSITEPSKTRSEGQTNGYLALTENGAIRYNYNTQELYIMGLELDGSKKVVAEGEDKPVKSSAKTIAKNVIKREYLKQGLIRNFTVKQISEVKMRGEELELN